MSTTAKPMTTEEFLALPDDGVHRELIHGELREYPMTTRGFPHSAVLSRVVYFLHDCVRRQPRPRGVVISGEARVRLRRDPETIVGVDVAYVAPELAARTPYDARLVDGPPALVVEILPPSDVQEDTWAKVDVYLRAGVLLVWVVEPIFGTVTVYCPGAEPELHNKRQEISADPILPGFRIAVAALFED